MNGKTIGTLLAAAGLLAMFYADKNSTKVSDFEAWKAEHGIVYESTFEHSYRERVFRENVAKIEAHNADSTQTYTQGVNQFTAMTQEEFAANYLGTMIPSSMTVEDSTDDVSVGDVDWVTQGAVTGVKNQGNCGSCWAFSTTGGLEGLSKLGFGSLQSFSEQQLVDCSGSYGNQACNGGLMDNAFKYVRDHGITGESDYPYKAVKGTCTTNSGSFKISGYTDVKDCTTLANAITGRPVSVAVDATNWSTYKSGTFSNCHTSLNHGVTLVGVTDAAWKVKNSWGTTWGESGYIQLARGNTCGICNVASYPNK